MKPMYKLNDIVEFIFWDYKRKDVPMRGKVVVVDVHGTFFDNSEPYYDVELEDGTWVKHIPQSVIINNS